MLVPALRTVLLIFFATVTATAMAAQPLRVVATVPELGSLVHAVGGEQVEVSVLAKPTEDPHFVDPRPSFVKLLNKADLYVQQGMEMESGWAPVLLENARNARILSGASGYLDASTAIEALNVPATGVDRSMGDVHPYGNPHYLADPLQGLRVASLLRDRLGELRPAQRAYFEERFTAFARQVAEALVGPELARRYGPDDVEKLVRLYVAGRLGQFLDSQGEAEMLGGWLGAMLPHRGVRAVDDHDIWPYFSRRFGIRVVGHLEPKPGIPPTTRHLRDLIEMMNADKVRLILASAYYDPRHARFVADNTPAVVVEMANQTGARPGSRDYLGMIDYNVRAVVSALEKPL